MLEKSPTSLLLRVLLSSSAVILLLVSFFLFFCPSSEENNLLLRALAISPGILAVVTVIVALKESFMQGDAASSYRIVMPPSSSAGQYPKSTTAGTRISSHQDKGIWARPHIDSSQLLKIAAEQKRTIEELRETVKDQQKQLAGSKLKEGFEDSEGTLILWNEKPFRRMIEAEIWRSRRTQRTLVLLLINFADERRKEEAGQPPLRSTGLSSSLWEYYAEVICRAVRRGDHVGLAHNGMICALLPETTTAGASIAEDRIRKLIFRERLRRKAETGIELVVDIAAAAFPKDGKEAAELLTAAQRGILRASRDH